MNYWGLLIILSASSFANTDLVDRFIRVNDLVNCEVIECFGNDESVIQRLNSQGRTFVSKHLAQSRLARLGIDVNGYPEEGIYFGEPEQGGSVSLHEVCAATSKEDGTHFVLLNNSAQLNDEVAVALEHRQLGSDRLLCQVQLRDGSIAEALFETRRLRLAWVASEPIFAGDQLSMKGKQVMVAVPVSTADQLLVSVVDKVATQHIPQSSVMTFSNTQRRPWVMKGDHVEALYQINNVVLTMPAQAIGEGSKGDKLVVEINDGLVPAIVSAPGQVLVQ